MTTTAIEPMERFYDMYGRSVRVRTHGEGPPVLLINGLGANVTMWSQLIRQLDGFQIITFDAPGTGRSETPFLPYTLSRLADIASLVLDELGLEYADVLGYSLGGAVAQQFAVDHPERVRRLVLVSCSCGAGAIPGSLRALMAVMTPARHYVKSGYSFAMKMVNLSPAERESTVLPSEMAGWHHESPPSVAGYMLQMAAFSVFNSLPWLHRIEQPTLVVSGTDDRLMPLANGALLAAHLPQARLRVFDRWGHYLLHDPESGAGEAIADFLRAEDHASSNAWADARSVDDRELAEYVRSAPRSGHPYQYTNAFVRRLYPAKKSAG